MSESQRAASAEPSEPGQPAVIVGVDGSESSVKALREARRVAEGLGAPLEAVAVWQQSHSMYDYYQSQSGWTPQKETEKLLADAAEAAFGQDLPARFRTTTLEGPPTKALIRHSAGAEMLVLGSRGHGGFSGLLLGSVSSACVAHATCPVLIVHNKDQVHVDAKRAGNAP